MGGTSIKRLQKFILSLDRNELIRVIQSYLKDTLRSQQTDLQAFGGWASRSNALINDIDNLIDNDISDLNPIDERILSKMKNKYGNKQHKKVLVDIQQKQPANKHILSMNPHVLAYSLQFLSFRESCRLQNACSYFVYLKKKYLAAS